MKNIARHPGLLVLIAVQVTLFAEEKLTAEEKLNLARAEAAVARANARLNGTVAEAQRQIQKLESEVREKVDALQKLSAELKKAHGLDVTCTFDEAQEPNCPEKKEEKK